MSLHEEIIRAALVKAFENNMFGSIGRPLPDEDMCRNRMNS